MNRDDELRKAYLEEIPNLEIFAKYIQKFIHELIANNPDNNFHLEEDIVKITSARVKDVKSFIFKAFYRGKKYENPMLDIEDKVGIRIVGYLQKSIDYICKILKTQSVFNVSVSRLPEKENFESPYCFDYKSTHYILTLSNDVESEGVTIPSGSKVELQLRTFEQDFFAYLTHDTIYKSNGNYISGKTKRKIAKTMALLETAQEIAMKTFNELNASEDQLLYLLDYLQTSYNIKFNDVSKEIEANLFFLDAVKDLISGLDESDLAKTVDDERIQNKIRTRRNSHYLFQLPIVFLIYYLLRVKKNDFRSVWPYTPDDLVPFLVDCGISQRD